MEQPVMEVPSASEAASVTGCPDFDYAPGQPNLYLMMRLKQELVSAHGLDHGFRLFTDRFHLADTTRLREVVVESERAFAQRHARFFRETAAAGHAFVQPALPVVGPHAERRIGGTTRSQYVACIEQAHVRGRSALIEADGHMLLDVQDGERESLDDEPEWDPAIFHAIGDRTWCIESSNDDVPLDIDEAFTLLGAHTDFFGHWMCQYLPKYVAARLSRLMPDMCVLIDAHMPQSHRQSLELLYGTTCRFIEVAAFRRVRVRKLWCAPTLSYWPFHEIRNERFTWDAISAAPSTFEPVIRELQQRFDASAAPSRPAPRRIYFGRKTFRHRRLVNSDRIEQVARDLGFEIVYPEDLPFSEQAATARNADVIVAPEGSAIFLTIFARPGTTLCILSHPFTDYLADYAGMFAPHQIHVTAITGPATRITHSALNDSDYRIDEETFRRLGSIGFADVVKKIP
jgi:capsular polysaccharide biosynthesis protein